MDAIELITFPKPKYGEQIVAMKRGGSFNIALFDACTLFMQDDTYAERQRVQDEAKAFAERFVAQMNAAVPNPEE